MATTGPNVSGARTTVRLPRAIHRRAKLAAAWSETKLQEFITEAVELHLIGVEAAMAAEKRLNPAPRARRKPRT